MAGRDRDQPVGAASGLPAAGGGEEASVGAGGGAPEEESRGEGGGEEEERRLLVHSISNAVSLKVTCLANDIL